MSDIDLSKYVGREVVLTFVNNGTLSGELRFTKNFQHEYVYVVEGWQFNKTGEGMSKPQIKSIQLKNPIAQQHPNINLEDFEGQRCYVKWSDGKESIPYVNRIESYNTWHISGTNSSFDKNGKTLPPGFYVKEIYGEGAYEITTRDTFDSPSDDVVTTATAVLKGLTKEQLARVLHNLKGKSN
jgi:hypothetical protein